MYKSIEVRYRVERFYVAIDLYGRLKEEISSIGWSRKDSLYFEVITIRDEV